MSDPSYATSKEAESAFYEAFQRADVEEMMKVWAEDDAIICIHPMGPRHLGRRAVARSWRDIFAGGPQLRFELAEVACTIDGDLAVHCVYEVIRQDQAPDRRSLVLATNIYRSTGRGWRMIVHHASPGVAPPAPAEDTGSTLH